jgi:selenocysteine lyase/cysteine desulfurase
VALTLEDLRTDPNPLASHYSLFRVADRLLLTGHSHQAWPDCGFDGQRRAWLDAAEWVDDKWARATIEADRVRAGYRLLLDDSSGLYSLAANTFELLVRLLSALPLRQRPKLVTTDSEFYSLRRLLARIEEEGIEIVRLAAHPAVDVGERLAAATDDRTAAVLTSTVFFNSAQIAGALADAALACRRHGAALILDAYHQLNVVPASLQQEDLDDAFVVGAGYKYCQLGEGNGFLRFPADCRLRPVATGWFAEFGELTQEHQPNEVLYHAGDDRFAGATYDPTSHYRAAEVFDFFAQQQLDPDLLRQISQHQIGYLIRLFDELDLDPVIIDRDRQVDLAQLGGFLALRSDHAAAIWKGLKDLGVATDQRARILRMGPAPYLSDLQLEEAMSLLGQAVKAISAR